MPQNGPERVQPLTILCTGKQGPVPPGSTIVPCVACLRPILSGQYFTQLPVGCGDDPKRRALARQNLPFEILFASAHWACVSGDESESRLSLV